MMFDYENLPLHAKPLLYLQLGEENRKIIFMDDLNNIYRKEGSQILRNIVKCVS